MLLILIGSTTLASADVISLTGGDPSGGLTLNNTAVVDAFLSPNYMSGIDNLVFQGVTFHAFLGNPDFTTDATLFIPPLTSDTAANAGFTNVVSPTTEDNNLLALMNAGLSYNSGNPTDVTISGLTANTPYVVDSITSLLGYMPDRSLDVGYNGNAPLLADSDPDIGENGIFDIQDTVMSNASGAITINYTSNSAPFFNAIVISDVPEPSTWAMMLAGVVFFGFWMRRKSSKFQI